MNKMTSKKERFNKPESINIEEGAMIHNSSEESGLEERIKDTRIGSLQPNENNTESTPNAHTNSFTEVMVLCKDCCEMIYIHYTSGQIIKIEHTDEGRQGCFCLTTCNNCLRKEVLPQHRHVAFNTLSINCDIILESTYYSVACKILSDRLDTKYTTLSIPNINKKIVYIALHKLLPTKPHLVEVRGVDIHKPIDVAVLNYMQGNFI